MEQNKKRRIEFIDALKGLAIFFVVWAHSVQYLPDNTDIGHTAVFTFIYSFHMPLFFMLSGMFFKSSLKLSFRQFLYKKAIQLVLPCCIWCAVFILCNLFYAIFQRNVDYLLVIKTGLQWPFWFLKELFLTYFIVYVFFKLFKKEWIVFVGSLCFVLIAPACGLQRVFLPFFLIGILIKDNFQFVLKHINTFLLVSAIVFGICLCFWNTNYTILGTIFEPVFNFKTLNFNFSKIDIVLFRFVTGLAGSIFFYSLLQKFYCKKGFYTYLEKAGTNTLGIYILHSILLERIFFYLIHFPTAYIGIYNFIFTPVIAVLLLIVCIGLIKLINKNKYVGLFLLGSSFQKAPLPF
ncbi:hypothetical protein EZS27_004432 [termite gut metagenome]|uniref:Acyltransferase 3 domain-containing protein n=1 Tax=termite gut metagenome TaxID=433724 RepID=A0A5J4SRY3_9ZZZZ